MDCVGDKMSEQDIMEIIENGIDVKGSKCTKIIIEKDIKTCDPREIISLINKKYMKMVVPESMEIDEEKYVFKATLRFIKPEDAKTCFMELIEKGCHVEDYGIVHEMACKDLEAPISYGGQCFIIKLT